MASAEKLSKLSRLLAEMQSVLVAFSGGADSAFLLKVASDVLGDNVIAATATGEIYPKREQEQAKELAEALGVRHVTFQAEQMKDADFVASTKDRCYFCARLVGGRLLDIAASMGAAVVVNGTNADDENDYRPGMRAARELGIRSPLSEVRLNKCEIIAISKELGLPTWDKPSDSCLATRVPYGVQMTVQRLARIEACEEFLRRLGLGQVRVRDSGDTARIESLMADMPRIVDKAVSSEIARHFKAQGYTYISLDIEGYRTGSMNETFGQRSDVG
ncbi:ATP-dependent sacrificial sulfur transferase LarE [bacterium]|nr:ATP-dependent sacrificial sulfur transferase LarE [bacterium]